jgi:trimeric autotransporter adhesin
MKKITLMLLLCAGALSVNAQTYSLSGEFSSMGTANLSLETNNTSRIVILGTSGFTGIGGITPAEMLHVNGNVLGNQYTAVNGIFNSSTDLRLSTLGTTRLTVLNTNGYVGIGNTPTESFDVFGTARLRAIPTNNALTRLLVSDATGKVFWRDVSSLTGSISNIPFFMSASGQTIGVGNGSLINNTSGSNAALGYNSLYTNTSGYSNTAMGASSLYGNTSGNHNSAFGSQSLNDNSTGHGNTAIGYYSMNYNVDGYYNTAIGVQSLTKNISGIANTGLGGYALHSNVGNYNTAIGYFAGPASTSIVIENATAIGHQAQVSASNTVRIGNSSVTSIGGQVSWSTVSDGRFKTEIKEDVSGLEFIKQLRPVSYSFDQNSIDSFLGIPDSMRQYNPSARQITPRQTGFIAQEVDELVKRTGYVFHGVEAPQHDKDHYSIRYGEFVVPLVKAVQELSATVELQQKKIDLLLKANKELGGAALEDEVILFQNRPNPFTTDTEIQMSIPKRVKNAELVIYDLSGKQLGKATITARGSVNYKIEAGKFKSGMYLYTLITDNNASETKRMILTD